MIDEKMLTIYFGRDACHDIPLRDSDGEHANVHEIITRFIENGMKDAKTNHEKKDALAILHQMNARYLFSDDREINEKTELRDLKFERCNIGGNDVMRAEMHALHPHDINCREPYLHVDPELVKECDMEFDNHRDYPIYLVLLNDEDLDAAKRNRGTFNSHEEAHDEALMFDEVYGDTYVATVHSDDDVEIDRVNADISHECPKCGHVDTFYAAIEDFNGYEDYCPECSHKFTWKL
jgi:hypothetical protein